MTRMLDTKIGNRNGRRCDGRGSWHEAMLYCQSDVVAGINFPFAVTNIMPNELLASQRRKVTELELRTSKC